MITDQRVDHVCQQLLQMRNDLDHFKDVVVNAVSKLNSRIKALEQRLPPPRSRFRRQDLVRKAPGQQRTLRAP